MYIAYIYIVGEQVLHLLCRTFINLLDDTSSDSDAEVGIQNAIVASLSAADRDRLEYYIHCISSQYILN